MNLVEDSLQGERESGLLFPQPEPYAQPAVPRDWLDVIPPLPNGKQLRPYQDEQLARVAQAIRTYRRVLVQAPTGSGKTVSFVGLIAAAVAAGLRLLVLATRTRLVRQIHGELDKAEVGHGVMAAAMPGLSNWGAKVQVASADTLYRRCLADKRMPLPAADVVIFDEAHLALGASRQAILDSYPNALLFGFTATPAKTSGACLTEQFDTLILGPTVSELIDLGFLVKPRIFAKPVISARELKAVHTDSKSGDFVTGELSQLMSRPKLVGDVVQNWLRIANGKRTLVFACDKAHGAQLLTEFRQAGVPAEQLTDADDETTREEVIARLEAGVTQVIVNCFLMSYGTDIPAVEAIVLARPTRSVVMYLQSVGRAMRPSDGKDHMILIDHGRVVENLGLPTYERDWSLDGRTNVNVQAREQLSESRKIGEEKPRHCAECNCIWVVSDEGNRCPHCGWTPPLRQRQVQVTDAELHEVREQKIPEGAMEQFFREACGWYAMRWPERWKLKENSGRWWAWMKTREKFKRPEDERIPSRYWKAAMAQPTAETAGWLKSQQIRWAKSKRREQMQQRPVAPAVQEWLGTGT